MNYSKNKIINRIVTALIKTGEWRAKRGSKHFRLENIATHRAITIPGSPSDHRATQNWLHQIKREQEKATLCGQVAWVKEYEAHEGAKK